MADKKISALTPSTTPLTGVEVLPIVQSGSTVKVSVADLTAGRAVAATSVTTGLGAVGTPAYTFAGDTNTGIYSPAADTIAFVEGGVEAARIDSAGNVGIGTSAPSYKLDIGGFAAATQTARIAVAAGYDSQLKLMEAADAYGFTIRNANGSGLNILRHSADATGVSAMFIGRDTGNVGINTTNVTAGYGSGKSLTLTNQSGVLFQNASNTWSTTTAGGAVTYFSDNNLYIDAKDSASNMLFRVNGATERMRITSAGDVGIGTSAPAGKLHVVAGTNDTLLFRGPVNLGTGGSIYAVNAANSAITPMEFAASNYYFGGGNVGIGTSSPASKLEVKGAGFVAASISGDSTSETQLRFNTNTSARISQQSNQALIFDTNALERVRIDSSGNMGVGAAPNASAILDVQSTTKGFRLPNMTTTQKNAISSPAAGLMVFDTTLAKACVYSGSAWQTITSV